VGDRLILRTQAVDATGCAVDADMDVDAYSFVITEVHQNRLVVGEESTAWLADGSQKAGPSAGSDCFPEATAYEVRVPDGVYAVKGSLSGFVHPVVTDESGACVVDASVDPMFRFRAPEWELASEQELEDCPPSDVDATAWFVHPDGGEAFHNHAFTARLIPGCEGSGTPEEPFRIVETQTDTTWKFFTDSAMTPRAIGGRGGGEPTMGNPRGLEWHRAKDVLYVIDAGQEKIVEIVPGQDNIRSQFF
jgi:hypothetical protein